MSTCREGLRTPPCLPAARQHPGALPGDRLRQPRADHLVQDRQRSVRDGRQWILRQAIRTQRCGQERHRVHPVSAQAWRVPEAWARNEADVCDRSPGPCRVVSAGMAPRCNTVQLREDGDEGWAVGLGPECVADAFDVPADVFAFDDPWVGAEPSGRVEPVGEPADCLGPAAFSVLRGESRPVGRWWHERC
jgi:hypothetical protein